MKATLISTTKIVLVNDVPCRVWEGTTSNGNPVVAFVAMIACASKEVDAESIAAELMANADPSSQSDAVPSAILLIQTAAPQAATPPAENN